MALPGFGRQGQSNGYGDMTTILSIFRGSVYGAALGGFLLTILALLGPQPDGSRLWDRPDREPAQVALQDEEAQMDEAAPDDDLAELNVGAVQENTIEFGDPSVPADAADLGNAVITGTESAPVPRVGLTLPAPTTPNDANLALPEAETFTPVLPNPLSVAPEVPQSEQDIIIATTPATPQPPVVVVEDDTSNGESDAEPVQEVVIVTDVPGTGTEETTDPAPVAADVASAPATPDAAPISEDATPTLEVELAEAPVAATPTLDTQEQELLSPQATNSLIAPAEIADPGTAPVVEGTAPNLDVAVAEPPATTIPTLDAQTAGEVSPQAANSIDAPQSLVDAETATAVEEFAPTLNVELAEAPAATIPTLTAQNAGEVSPQATNTINTPDTLAEAATPQDLAALDDLSATQSDTAPPPATDPLATPDEAVELAIADETATRPAQPRASVNEDAVDLATAAPAGTSDAPDLGDLADTTEPVLRVLTPRTNTDTPDPTVAAALPEDSVDDVTNPAEPAEVDVAQAVVPAEPEAAPTVRILGRDSLATALPTSTSGVRINRSITRDAPEAETTDATPTAPQTPTDGPALARFAAPFTNAADLPLITLLLKDDGALENATDALSILQAPVTIVLDPTLPDASDRAETYRAAGYEVAMSIALPFGANASDAAIVLEAGLLEVPEAVALVDLTQNGLMSNRDIAGQIRQAANEDGRGLIVPIVGLGGLRSGSIDVPMAEIYRDLNSAQQNARTLGRFLDQAAFEARQQGAVVLTGQLNAETIDAIVAFKDSQRGRQVALAPVSAALK